MDKLKQLLALLLCAAMLLSLAACGSDNSANSDDSDVSASDVENEPEDETDEPEEEEKSDDTEAEESTEVDSDDLMDMAEDDGSDDVIVLYSQDGEEMIRIEATDDIVSYNGDTNADGEDTLLVTATVGSYVMRGAEMSAPADHVIRLCWFGILEYIFEIEDETDDGYVVSSCQQYSYEPTDCFLDVTSLTKDGETDPVVFNSDLTCSLIDDGEEIDCVYFGNDRQLYLAVPVDESLNILSLSTMDDYSDAAYFVIVAYTYTGTDSSIEVSDFFTLVLDTDYFASL